MIVLLHPRSTRPKNRRFPLAILSVAAVLEGREDYVIIDGNLDPDPGATLDRVMREEGVELLAVSVMPGPQMVSAIPLCSDFRKKYPAVPIVWGGYFPSVHPEAALNTDYVDFIVRGQGEETLLEIIDARRGKVDLSTISGLSYKDGAGCPVHNAERHLRSPNEFPWLPYHRIEAAKYVLPTFLGARTAVHQASVGCPYPCNFCGVITAYGSREKMESPERTEKILRHLQQSYGINAVQFYDNNFFLGEGHAVERAERLKPLNLRWWTEARVDILLRYSDETLRKIRDSGAAMIFFGAESGSDWVLRQMNKQLEAEQTLELARRLRDFGIIPEFSFVVGNPEDPARDVEEGIAFIRRIKRLNPDSEIVLHHYRPTPQRDSMYGGVDGKVQFPASPEEWATPRWQSFVTGVDTKMPWLPDRIKRRVDNFDLVVGSRWPTAQDIRTPRWGRALLRSLSGWRYALGVYGLPVELRWAQQLVDLRKPRLESL